MVSPQAEVIFEDENGEVDNIFEDEVPYDLNAPVIEIRREDYGIWYVDMMENPDRYKGKVVEFVAKVMKPRAFPSKVFLPGRTAMTCCADDTSFLGYVCRSPYAPKLKPGDWVKVRAKVSFKNLSVYRGEGPVLDAENIEPAEPIEEMVYFNKRKSSRYNKAQRQGRFQYGWRSPFINIYRSAWGAADGRFSVLG